MTAKLMLTLTLFVVLGLAPLTAQTPDWDFAQSYGGSTVQWGEKIATDFAGNRFIIGCFQSTATFGSTVLPSGGSLETFVAKIDPAGNVLWARGMFGAGWDYGQDIDTDAEGNCYITGYFNGHANFGDIFLTGTDDGFGNSFVAKLDTNGNWLWAVMANSPYDNHSYSLSTDSAGNCYITGDFVDTLVLGPFTLSNPGWSGIVYAAKLDSSGNWLWAQQAMCVGAASWGIDSAPSGESVICGNFQNTAVFGATTLSSYGGYDAFVAKLDAAGNWLWAQNWGGAADEGLREIALAPDGSSYVTGSLLAGKVDSAGNWLWTKQNTVGWDGGSNSDIAVDAAGSCYLTGYYSGEMTFDSIVLPDGDNNWNALYVVKLDPAGNCAWYQYALGTRDVFGMGITLDPSGNVLISGELSRVGTFGSITVTTAALGYDILLARLPAPEPNVPVTLSSFTASLTAQNAVRIAWVSETETNLLGYRLYRNESASAVNSQLITPELIPATNSSSQQSYAHTDSEVEPGHTYYYWLESVEAFSSAFWGPASVLVEETAPPLLPELSALHAAYPNPFRSADPARIKVELKAGETGTLCIYNLQGQRVHSYPVSQGWQTLAWDGRDSHGKPCASGVYLYRLSTPTLSQTRKLVLQK